MQSRCATKRGPKRLFTLKSDRRRAAATRTARLAMRSLRAMVLCALALIVLVATSASAAVLGIDYGSEYLKVSIVAPGRTPISIVINEISKRKSTAAVAFTGGDRWLAEEAMNYNARFPERTFTRLRDLLGKDASVKYFQDYVEKYKLSYKVVADKDRGTARIVAENGAEYAVEELVAMILQYAVKIGEGMGKGVIKDAVIAIPPYFGQTDRYALYDAADCRRSEHPRRGQRPLVRRAAVGDRQGVHPGRDVDDHLRHGRDVRRRRAREVLVLGGQGRREEEAARAVRG